MEEQVKNIISLYSKIAAEQINRQTVIDRSAVASSIILHRMYAHLAKEGWLVENYADIRNYGQLLQYLNSKQDGGGQSGQLTLIENNNLPTANTAIGIDIEKISNLPIVNDYREDDFYKMNFASSEIAYCVLQSNPVESFAGLFAAKEAIVKADNRFRSIPFNSILIDHLPGGKPIHAEFELSISHTSELAVAVAVRINRAVALSDFSVANKPSPTIPNFTLFTFVSTLALMISLLAITLFFFKGC